MTKNMKSTEINEESYPTYGMDKNNVYLNNTHDINVHAGNRLYVQALERFKRHEARIDEYEDSKQPSSHSSLDRHDSFDSRDGDLSVKAGHRLYSQAIERLRRREARWVGENEDCKQSSGSSIERHLGDSLDSRDDDPSVKAGNRLYTQALERMKRHEAKRKGKQQYAEQKDDDVSVSKEENPSVKAGNRLYSQALERFRRHEAMRMESSNLDGSKQHYESRIEYIERLREDKTVEAGNRLYTQALERIRRHESMIKEAYGVNHNRTSSEDQPSYDLTVEAGNRLYTKAIERLKRREAMTRQSIDEEISYIKSLHKFGDKTDEACNRLYFQALEQNRRHEMMRAEASKPCVHKLDLATQKLHGVTENSDRFVRLYRLSSEKQVKGKQRRAQIEEEKARARRLPESKVLPASQSDAMYIRGMERIMARESRLASIAAELKSERT